MKNKIKRNRFKILMGIIIIIAATLCTKYDYGIYDETIATITDVKNKQINGNNSEEKYYQQTITLLIRNGTYKGNSYTAVNEYNTSRLDTTKYKKGDDVFVSITEANAVVLRLKLDIYVVLLVTIFMTAVFLLGKRLGALVLLSLLLNTLLFQAALTEFIHTEDIGILSAGLIFLFVVLTLLVLNGFSKKAFGSIISSLSAVFIIYIIYSIVYHYTKPPAFELMHHVVGSEEPDKLYAASIIIGALGAIMDISITINSAVSEITETSGESNLRNLIQSIRQIGYDIMGTMISVLFFSNLSEDIMMIVVKIKNGYSFLSIFKYDLIFEYIRFIIGAIGIVLAIPISGAVAIALFKNNLIKKQV